MCVSCVICVCTCMCLCHVCNMCVFSESDSLHEDRRAGLIPELEGEEDSSKINPPSNGTVACAHTAKLPNVVWGCLYTL